jgi:hypothetical protein
MRGRVDDPPAQRTGRSRSRLQGHRNEREDDERGDAFSHKEERL